MCVEASSDCGAVRVPAGRGVFALRSAVMRMARPVQLAFGRFQTRVIIPFLSGQIAGLHSASFCFMARVIPPMPIDPASAILAKDSKTLILPG